MMLPRHVLRLCYVLCCTGPSKPGDDVSLSRRIWTPLFLIPQERILQLVPEILGPPSKKWTPLENNVSVEPQYY